MRAELRELGIAPQVIDGSGLSRSDRTSPREVVTMLEEMDGDASFAGSLAIAGRTGTLEDRMRGTRAQDRCRAKTGTLRDVSALAGYCTTTAGGARRVRLPHELRQPLQRADPAGPHGDRAGPLPP